LFDADESTEHNLEKRFFDDDSTEQRDCRARQPAGAGGQPVFGFGFIFSPRTVNGGLF